MRIAVIADVHGNLRALESVLDDIRRRAPDLVVNLGDCLSGPLQAAATADLLIDRAFVTVRGNHDRQLLDRAERDMGASDRAAAAELTERHRQWLTELPPTRVVENVLLCHGTPSDDSAYLLEAVAPDGSVSLDAVSGIRARLGRPAQPVVLCGHTHLPRVVSVPDGPLVVNPGSVGLPAFEDVLPYPHVIEVGSPHARYAVVDLDQRRLHVELVAVEYDWASASRDAARAERADWAQALATGRAGVTPVPPSG